MHPVCQRHFSAPIQKSRGQLNNILAKSCITSLSYLFISKDKGFLKNHRQTEPMSKRCLPRLASSLKQNIKSFKCIFTVQSRTVVMFHLNAESCIQNPS